MNINYDDVKIVEGIMTTGCECYGQCRGNAVQYCKLERFRKWVTAKQETLERSDKPEPEDIY